MKTHISLGGQQVALHITPTQGRQRLKLWFEPGSSTLQVRAPGGRLGPEAQAFIQQKRRWILRNVQTMGGQEAEIQEFYARLARGEVLYLGTWRKVNRGQGQSRRARFLPNGNLEISGVTTPGPEITLAAVKALAKPYLQQRTAQWAVYTGHDQDLNRVTVRSQQTRWGSCSAKGNINLNWRLALMPPELSDYVIIHELMHLRHMNHSPAYWQEVARYCPDYKRLRKAVQGYGWSLNLKIPSRS